MKDRQTDIYTRQWDQHLQKMKMGKWNMTHLTNWQDKDDTVCSILAYLSNQSSHQLPITQTICLATNNQSFNNSNLPPILNQLAHAVNQTLLIILCYFIILLTIQLPLFSIDEATWWVNTLRPSGGCNLLGALKTVLKRREIDSIILVLGNA